MPERLTKKLTWVVVLAVSPERVANGFSLDDSNAHDMLAHFMPFADGSEMEAMVLDAPNPHIIAELQGYKKPSVKREMAILKLSEDVKHAHVLRNAMRNAHALLVSKEDNKSRSQVVIKQLEDAISLIDFDSQREEKMQ